eukprot:4317399-Amphidinium_carterae.2
MSNCLAAKGPGTDCRANVAVNKQMVIVAMSETKKDQGIVIVERRGSTIHDVVFVFFCIVVLCINLKALASAAQLLDWIVILQFQASQLSALLHDQTITNHHTG